MENIVMTEETLTLKHWIIVTDTNSRQYPFQIPENGFEVETKEKTFVVTSENPNLKEFHHAIQSGLVMTLNNSVFNPAHLVGVDYKTFY